MKHLCELAGILADEGIFEEEAVEDFKHCRLEQKRYEMGA